MQERYLGDSHDFIKYALLRHIARRTSMRIGLNWYLTDPNEVDPSDNNDGEKRHHLKGDVWRSWDGGLLTKLEPFAEPSQRELSNFYAADILPSDTLYHDAIVPSFSRSSQDERDAWQQDALRKLYDTDFVFLDPDNGLQVKSMTIKRSPKYALYSELAAWIAAGKLVTTIQFARQCDPVKKAKDICALVKDATQPASLLPTIRARVAPNLLLITAGPKDKCERVAEVLNSFVHIGPKVEFV